MFTRRSLLACLLMTLGLAATAPVASADTLPLRGQENPVLALNLSTAHDWNPGMQFLDLMKSARPWIGHRPREWGGMTFTELQENGYIDENGWPIAIPPELGKVGTVFSWTADPDMATYRKGRYVIRYAGTGRLSVGGDARIVARGQGRLVIVNDRGRNWWLNILRTAPDDHVRDISIVAEKHVDLYDAGAVFNPDWLALISDSRQLRFMDWMQTNNSQVATWDDRPRPEAPFQDKGHALEYMIQLANEVGANPWFTMPHLADHDYIRRFAEQVRDTLDPRLIARVEWSNETWNSQFQQTRWVRAQSKALWGEEAPIDYTAKHAVETAVIWRDVFREEPHRLKTVLGSRTGSTWYSDQLLNADTWRRNAPKDYIEPVSVFDEIAVTTYFGDPLVTEDEDRADLIRAVKTPGIDLNSYIDRRVRIPENRKKIDQIAQYLEHHKELTQQYQMKLVAYEGGQHLHAFIRPRLKNGAETPREDLDLLHDALGAYVRSPQMGELYQQIWQVWEELGDGPFMQFSDIGRQTQYGSWGLYTHLADTSPRIEVVTELARTRAPWWPATGGAQYQEGIISQGTAGTDTLLGTIEEDYLLGKAGDDYFHGSPGRDGINGGPGTDSVQYPGRRDEYDIRREGQGIRVIGPNSSDYLYAVETLRFAEGGQMDLTTLP